MTRTSEDRNRPTWRLRQARAEDLPALQAMIGELAAYEREPEAVEGDAEDLGRALFADPPLVHAVVAEVDGPDGPQVSGMALWYVTYSTWKARHGIWLEDLFVRPEARRLGLGRALLGELAAEAVRRGYGRLEWNVLDWNAPALAFYAQLGAEPLAEWTMQRVTGDALTKLATDNATGSANRANPA